MNEIIFSAAWVALLLFPAASRPDGKPFPKPGDVDERVERIMVQLSLERKIDLIGDVDDFFIRGFAHLGWPRLRMADGPLGVRNFGPSTVHVGRSCADIALEGGLRVVD
jgi:hypothetical protein